jgi:hypothetical protein
MNVAVAAAAEERLANSDATEYGHQKTQFDGLENRFHF